MARGLCITVDEKNNLFREFQGGVTRTELVKKYDICLKTVNKIIKECWANGEYKDNPPKAKANGPDGKTNPNWMTPQLKEEWEKTRLILLSRPKRNKLSPEPFCDCVK